MESAVIVDLLGEFARTVAYPFSGPEALERLVRRTVDLLPVRSAGVAVVGPRGERRTIVAPDGLAGELTSIPLRDGSETVGWLELYTEPGTGRLEGSAAVVAQSMADVAAAYVLIAQEGESASAEHRDMEGRMQQSERLASLGELAGGVAHDFNNLLTVIVNYAGFIADGEHNDDETRAQATEIVASAERGAALTKQLLLFARREPVHRAPIDLRCVVRDVRELLVQAVGETIEVVIVEPDDLPLVTGDRGQLEQVLMNLAVNARDAMPGGGTLTVETSLAHDGDDSGVQLRVTDVGEGMEPDVAARAFDPFFTTKLSGRGSGLGLATVYGIVVDAGGTIDLTTAPGQGATFRVRWPASTEVAEAPLPPPAPSLVRGHGESILVVEDQVPVRKVIVAMLSRHGYAVVEAEDAAAALVQAAAQHFDLVLTDIVMPGLSGRDLVTEVRTHRPLQRALYMSGFSGGAFGAQRALDPGEAMIHKPFREADLLAAVQAALDGVLR